MSATNRVEFEINCPESAVTSVVTCLVNTIIFHRALLNPRVQEVESETLNLSYPSVQSNDIQKKIESSIREFSQTISTKKDGSNLQINLIFSVKVIGTGLFGREVVTENDWEKWSIKFVLKENKSLEEDVVKKMNLVIQKVYENSGLMPQLTNDSRVSIDGCFPFKIEFEKSSKPFWGFGF